LLQLGDVDLFHLEHRLHGSFRSSLLVALLFPEQAEFQRCRIAPVESVRQSREPRPASRPRSGLALIDALAAPGDLNDYQLLHAARADLLRRVGAATEAAESYERALELVTNDSEPRYLERRLREVQSLEA
jgi:RNA polymerase sigma-70 factor (ECF subfamily)